GFSRGIARTTTMGDLTPGTYSVSAQAAESEFAQFTPTQGLQTLELLPGRSLTVEIKHVLATGVLEVFLTGIPPTEPAATIVSGPNGASWQLTASDTLTKLQPGVYTITSPNVIAVGRSYVPDAASLTVDVVASAIPAQRTVAYAPYAGVLNLTIDGLYITQAVQNLNGDVPLVAGRDGLLRVFVRANASNSAQPVVRVRLYDGVTLVSTLLLDAPTPTVATSVEDAAYTSAWTAPIPGSFIKPGLSIFAEVDPSNAVPEIGEWDNAWPRLGSTTPMVVKNVPPFSVRLVPIAQSNGLVAGVSAQNAAAYLNDIRRMYPMSAIDVDVRAPYTSTSGVVQSNDNNGAWNALLSEINALRAIDGSARYYYGIVKTTYSSGVAGIGFLGAPGAVGWDFLPSGADVMAHELGHNWGRLHAPCGGAAFADPTFPYPSGNIGVSGFDLTTSTFKVSTLADIMSYCVPAWVSDFNYKGIMSYRETSPYETGAQTKAAEPGLLVWGRITSDSLVLEPAFDVSAPPSLPSTGGPNRIEANAEDGTQVFSLNFDGSSVDHGGPEDRQFAFVVPKRAFQGRTLGALRLSAPGRFAELRSSALSRQELARQADGFLRVRQLAGATTLMWSSPSVRGALVRDARTGEVLAIARTPSARLATNARDVDVVVSDGVRSWTHRLPVR
ncbi:MAG TPA: hypothetical protein VGQ52_12110, partial [Gemmatimonadaceae bacterium]|nr:hypothetical protein [Gemmatimonadaceae bacterium]